MIPRNIAINSNELNATMNKFLNRLFLSTLSGELAKANAPIVENGLIVTICEATAIVTVSNAGETVLFNSVDKLTAVGISVGITTPTAELKIDIIPASVAMIGIAVFWFINPAKKSVSNATPPTSLTTLINTAVPQISNNVDQGIFAIDSIYRTP